MTEIEVVQKKIEREIGQGVVHLRRVLSDLPDSIESAKEFLEYYDSLVKERNGHTGLGAAMGEAVWISNADAEHHARFAATGRFTDGRDIPTPIEVVQKDVMPLEYLDKFQSDSQWYDDIEKYKMDRLIRHVVSGFYQLNEDEFVNEMKLQSLDEKTVKLIWGCLNDMYEVEQSRPK